MTGDVVHEAGVSYFAIGSRSIEVVYYLVRVTGETSAEDDREKQWVTLDQARRLLTYDDSRRMLDAVETHLRR